MARVGGTQGLFGGFETDFVMALVLSQRSLCLAFALKTNNCPPPFYFAHEIKRRRAII
ncbi:MAG: hypothetical protein ACI8WB_003159 [Phenylobacterium sp.]|jgi:hypothetical protein